MTKAPRAGATLRGRRREVEALTAHVRRGDTVLLHGPVGIGKSALLDEVQAQLAAEGVRCGHAARTAALADVVNGLQRAYPDVTAAQYGRRRMRSRLLLAAESEPGVLLLDHIAPTGTATKALIRSLRTAGMAMLMAADAETSRDVMELRALRLTHRLMPIGGLPPHHLKAVLEEALATVGLATVAWHADRARLIRALRGRPGWARATAERLQSPRYWNGKRIRVARLESDLLMLSAERYMSSERKLSP